MTKSKIKRPEKNLRLKEMKVRFNEVEYEKILERQNGKTFGGWLRRVALGHVPTVEADPDLVRNIGRIGSNLNQVARYANTQEAIDQKVLNEIVAIRKILHQMMEQNIADAIDKEKSNDC